MMLNKDEKIVVRTMLEWVEKMSVKDSFLPGNACFLSGLDKRKDTIIGLVNKNILKIKDCEDYALEFTDEFLATAGIEV